MFRIELAGLGIRIDNRYEHVRALCRHYLAPEGPADLTVSVSEEELRGAAGQTPDRFFGPGYAESVLLYGKIADALPVFDAFVMHASAVAADGFSFAFAAESGVGKSTHARYWKEVLGDRAVILNGDKPVFRFAGDRLLAWGTPWCGKEGWNANTFAPLRALCLLERGEANAVVPADAFAALGGLLRHFHLPGGGQADRVKLMALIDRMICTVPVYRLRCRNDVTAAEHAARFFGLL